MALIDCKFYSETLKISTAMMVILPQNTETQIGMKNTATGERLKTLYLLHGLSDDHTIWTRRTSIERYAAPLGLAVVMPAVNRSFYTDMVHGAAYESFIGEELPEIARSFFHLSERREDTYIAGLSMGGYGAFKIALNRPDRYAAAASLSGVLDIARRAKNPEDFAKADILNAFGKTPALEGTRHDLFSLLERAVEKGGELPRLFLCCGQDDSLHEDGTNFYDRARKLGLDPPWHSDPGYAHSWDYWDFRIQTVLEWMLGSSR